MFIHALCAITGLLAGFLLLLAYASLARRWRKRKAARKSEPKKLEFAQKMVFITSVYAMVIVLLVLGANFYLLNNDKMPMSEETVTTITVFGGITSTLVFGGYSALTAIRNCSLNKCKRQQPSSDVCDEAQ